MSITTNRPLPLSITDLIAIARGRSPFYKELYKNVGSSDLPLEKYPLIEQADFWKATSQESNQVLTESQTNGVVFKSGGTTGAPKHSVFTKSEWHYFNECFGRGIAAGGLTPGSRVANLFYAGELYASFLFIAKSLELAPVETLHFPIGGATPVSEIINILNHFQIDTLAGAPTTIMSIIEYLEQNQESKSTVLPPIARILFGGETMYPDQRARISALYPAARISSIGYASVDAGLLGYTTPNCGPGVHFTFSNDTIVEVIDEDTGATITEPHRPGKLVVTNLGRLLMPIIRYPVGDRAQWLDQEGQKVLDGGGLLPTDRRFQLLGRSEEAARVGPISLYYEDVRQVLESFSCSDYQLVLEHHDSRDGIILRIASPTLGKHRAQDNARRELRAQIIEALYRARPLFPQLVAEGKVHAPVIEFVAHSALQCNHRTGKLRRIIDQRSDERFGVC